MYKVIHAVTNDIVTDNRLHKIAVSLQNNGYDATIVGRRKRRSKPLNNRPYQVRRFRLWFNRGPLFYANYNIRLFFYLLAVKCDIIVSNDLDTLSAAYLASKIRKKPLVFDSHEYFTEVPELVDRPMVKGIWKFFEKKIVPNLKFGYTVSSSIAEHYAKEYGVSFEIVRNVGHFRYEHEFTEIQTNTDRQIILYQGALNRGRGLELAIEAMQFMPLNELWIIGSGDVEEDLKKLCRRLNLDDRVRFLGRIPLEQLWNYTHQANLGLSLEEDMGLNYRYALPNKIFDYIQARIPVLSSDLPEMKKVIEQYRIGEVLKERKPQELANQILGLLNDKVRLKKITRNLELAARELCWQREEQKIVMLYRKVIESLRD